MLKKKKKPQVLQVCLWCDLVWVFRPDVCHFQWRRLTVQNPPKMHALHVKSVLGFPLHYLKEDLMSAQSFLTGSI